MQILLNIPEGFIPDDSLQDREIINREYGLQSADEVHLVNIGPGADWIVYLAVFNVAWNIFQLPGIIKASIEGWEWLIGFFKNSQSKKQLISLDQDAAGLLAIDYLADKYGDDESFDIMDAHTIPIVDISGMVRNRVGGLANHPHNYYVFTFRIAGRIIILSVRSSGEIKEIEAFSDMPYGLSSYEAD